MSEKKMPEIGDLFTCNDKKKEGYVFIVDDITEEGWIKYLSYSHNFYDLSDEDMSDGWMEGYMTFGSFKERCKII